ncbi:MAG: tripartite tricarboxylate transporter TctB family protein [Alphaproteobacteria bacterium]|nr:tripartite tricarboxylate transporter TctB family protein [Alphaproteobacteria bacterium]
MQKLEFRDNKDFWSGVMLVIVGAASVIVARNYAFGTSLRMGPGYFPTVLGSVLVLFGLYLMVAGLRRGEKIDPDWSLRGLILLPTSLVLFGILMSYTGFIPAMMVLVFGSAAAGTDFRPVEALILAIGLTVFTAVIFIWGIGLPYPLLMNW